jgi:hypothetical protein
LRFELVDVGFDESDSPADARVHRKDVGGAGAAGAAPDDRDVGESYRVRVRADRGVCVDPIVERGVGEVRGCEAGVGSASVGGDETLEHLDCTDDGGQRRADRIRGVPVGLGGEAAD